MQKNELTYSAFESRYRNKQYIGSGGFAKVYKVFDHAKNHYVALKVADVRPEWNKFTLKNEVELVNRLPLHRNIARYDACYRFNTGFTGEMDFAVLRFYEYGNLEQFLSKQKMDLEDRRLIIQGILEGTAFLHRNNVIHRDLKSQNILLHREDGVWTPKITDFGLSREILGDANITNSAIGLSYAYAAPEQIQNKKIYKNVDLWAIGIIIYRVIADELPFKGRSDGQEKSTESQLEISRKIINLELPEKLNTIQEPYQSLIRKCLVLDPTERVQTAEELISLLNDDNVVIESPRPSSSLTGEEKTEIIDVVQTPETPEVLPIPPVPLVSKPPKEPNEKKEVKTQVDAEKNDLPPVFKPAVPDQPVKGYSIPKENPDPLISKKASKKASKKEISSSPPKSEYQPLTGDPKKSYTWVWVLLTILISGGVLATWWWMQQKNTPQSLDNNFPVYIAKDSSNQINNENNFLELEEQIDKIKGNKKALADLELKIQQLVKEKENEGNYRLQYLYAKFLAKQGARNNRKAMAALKHAAAIAIKNQSAEDLLLDIKKDEQKVFSKLSKIEEGKNWNTIIHALETSIK